MIGGKLRMLLGERMSKVSKADLYLLGDELIFVCDARGHFEDCDYTDGYKNRCPYKDDVGCICKSYGAIEKILVDMKNVIDREILKRGINHES